ncbi:50S ribosomal protein L30 [Alphaproteobacteria bacterium]|jgi:large subunit ribosomal protein L30|nr:50S ribosomal protein L30 [Alphaproteobacteria bacterium]
MATKNADTLKVKMTGSYIGCTEKQKANLRGLGLKKRETVRELEDTPSVRGMIEKVKHLVAIVE